MAGDLIPRVSVADVALLSVKELYSELAKQVTTTAESIYRTAQIWTELEKRGQDLSKFKNASLSKYYYHIATGELLADLVVTFLDKPYVLNAVLGAPLALQRKLLDGYKIKIYVPGQAKPGELTLDEMPRTYVDIAFSDGKILGPDKQKAALQVKNRPKISTVKRRLRTRVLVNKAKNTVTIGQTSADIGNVIDALSQAGGAAKEVVETAGRQAKVLATKVTDEEYARIEQLSKEYNISVQEMVRKAVLAMWMV
jgi:hypothetical protein